MGGQGPFFLLISVAHFRSLLRTTTNGVEKVSEKGFIALFYGLFR